MIARAGRSCVLIGRMRAASARPLLRLGAAMQGYTPATFAAWTQYLVRQPGLTPHALDIRSVPTSAPIKGRTDTTGALGVQVAGPEHRKGRAAKARICAGIRGLLRRPQKCCTGDPRTLSGTSAMPAASRPQAAPGAEPAPALPQRGMLQGSAQTREAHKSDASVSKLDRLSALDAATATAGGLGWGTPPASPLSQGRAGAAAGTAEPREGGPQVGAPAGVGEQAPAGGHLPAHTGAAGRSPPGVALESAAALASMAAAQAEPLEAAFQEGAIVCSEPDAVRVRSPTLLTMAFFTPIAHAASHPCICLPAWFLGAVQGPRSNVQGPVQFRMFCITS